MRYAIFKGETNLKDLVTRLFHLPDNTAKTAKRAGDTLLQANPQLRHLSKVPVGTVLNIPADAPPLRPSENAPAVVPRQLAVARQAQQSLYSLNQKLQEIDARAVESANAFVALAQSDQLHALVQKSADLKEQLPTTITSAQTLVKSVRSELEAQNQTIADLQTRLHSPAN
jgi:hypothetical protein